MPGLFSRLKGNGKLKSKKGALDQLANQQPKKPRWDDAWTRKTIEPDEVQELIRFCTEELKARALDLPFLLLPFRPTSDPSAVRTFVRHFFDGKDGGQVLRGEALAQELRMTEPMVISGVVKWCWSRLQGGVVGWDSYELFKVGEQDSHMARDSFKTFIPLSVDSAARSKIIFDFFDLLAATAAHSKMNGFGGRKLSRMAAWWAFEHTDNGNGFEGGYKSWLTAADATSHLFFAYLRSLAPEPTTRGAISLLPMSLQKLLQETEYPPQRPALLQTSTYRVAMIVDTVSPTPFALLRRANHFQYRDDDRALKEWSEYEDPIQALTEECRRVLRAISAANQSQAVSSSKHSTSLRDASWSRFEDIGFASALEEDDLDEDSLLALRRRQQQQQQQGLRTTPASGNGDLGRPTTPSWADFLSSGFHVDEQGTSNMLLPPDKVLPPIDTGAVRQRSSQSHKPRLETEHHLEPGELASIVRFDLDDAFWWVWMSSLAPEETPERKAAFGRCAVIETIIRTGRWLVMEELVKGAAPDPEEGAYIAEKKGFFSWTRRGRIGRRKSTGKHALDKGDGNLKGSSTIGFSKTSIGTDQQAKIQAAALQLQRQAQQKSQQQAQERRGRKDTDWLNDKTNSVLTLQSSILNEASPAVKWASKYDKEAIRDAYLADANAGRGAPASAPLANGHAAASTSEQEHRPELPPKLPSSPPPLAPVTTSSPSSAPQRSDALAPAPAPVPVPKTPTREETEVEVPKESHPVERAQSPLPPPKDVASVEVAREQMVSPEPDASPERQKQKKLHKELAKPSGGSGLMKLFSRNKNRSSRLPDNAAEQLKSFTAAAEQSTPAPAPVSAPAAPAAPAPPQKSAQREVRAAPPKEQPAPQQKPQAIPTRIPVPVSSPASPAPVRAPAPEQEPAAEPAPVPVPESPVPQEVSPVTTRDAAQAKEEFSRFDQGPLADQPAFVPDDDGDDVDDAVPPPIARHPSPRIPSPPVPAQQRDEDDAAPPPAPVARAVDPQDRWAQIRKNAAERAAQRQAVQPARTSGSLIGDDNSSEETIESRVARIKARVAELTAGAEAPGGPGAVRGPPPPLRRLP
ncbi:hypothetical protein N658DRAFT_482892 [Parathielavia hyrcaniae]|uniref:Meiotically up-regulated protein Msb1/Mug8 domain-containing protein n=1 Tax=Parathielavia hyrcaniae TaxID=113614 RepID=A0AAN6T617_9PEZI|nr:hypothetical protein N658DRAFT_482892 [Parathielavia hyrcaniae]